MTTYAIGDIHGCFGTLRRLLDRIGFDSAADRLWLVGDLVNRGPHSLEVLRWARGLGPQLTTVLGNHDLHLLARVAGVRDARARDTLDEVLAASDRDELLEWLAGRPLLHREGGFVLVHAGLLPAWGVEQAESLAKEVEAALRSPKRTRLLAAYSDGELGRWKERLRGTRRLQRIASAMTRLRTCTADGRPCLGFNGPPADAPRGCSPWFDRRSDTHTSPTIVFGHWATLGLYRQPRLLGLDSGCVWGGALSAVRLDDGRVFQEPYGEVS